MICTSTILFNFIITNAANLESQYRHARHVRVTQGHAAAVPLYQQLITQENPQDITAASRIAANPSAPKIQEQICYQHDQQQEQKYLLRQLQTLLQSSHYHTTSIAELLQIPEHQARARAPVYLTPSSAGTTTQLPFPLDNPTALECLVALFLLGLCVPQHTLRQCFSHSQVAMLTQLGLVAPCCCQSEYVVPYVSIMPLQQFDGKSLYIVTDWHPRVLSLTDLGQGQHNAVMYIGPDTLALIQHWIDGVSGTPETTWLDLCTGSGIQAMVAAQKAKQVIALDINERALHFCRLNAILNQLDHKITLVRADLLSGKGSVWNAENELPQDLSNLLQSYDIQHVICNPPFLPVPPKILEARHSLFSSGGASGEAVMAAALQYASQLVNLETLAMVSEFFLQDTANPAQALEERLKNYWGTVKHPVTVHGLLLTNEEPISADTYAQRRADSAEEYEIWKEHLEDLEISSASPGLLILQRAHGTEDGLGLTDLQHVLVPKSRWGSIWTPSNPFAVQFVRNSICNYFENTMQCSNKQ